MNFNNKRKMYSVLILNILISLIFVNSINKNTDINESGFNILLLIGLFGLSTIFIIKKHKNKL